MPKKIAKTITLRLSTEQIDQVQEYMDGELFVNTMAGAYTHLMARAKRMQADDMEQRQTIRDLEQRVRVLEQTLEEARTACAQVVDLTSQTDLL